MKKKNVSKRIALIILAAGLAIGGSGMGAVHANSKSAVAEAVKSGSDNPVVRVLQTKETKEEIANEREKARIESEQKEKIEEAKAEHNRLMDLASRRAQAEKAVASIYDGTSVNLAENVTATVLSDAKNSVEAMDDSQKGKADLLAVLDKATDLFNKQNDADTAMRKVWDFGNGCLAEGATRDLLADAQAKVEALPDGNNVRSALSPAISASDAAFTLKENEEKATALAQSVWDFNNSSMADGTTREMIDAAKAAINALPDGDSVKNQYSDAVASADATLAAQERDIRNNTVPALDGATGTHGRLIIPDVGYSAALYDGGPDNGQAICNNADSALIGTWKDWGNENGMRFIADHVNQGFGNMRNSTVGYTKAYIVYADGSYETWQCFDATPGYESSTYDMISSNDGQSIVEKYPGDNYIVMYTCNPAWPNWYATFWERV